VSYEEINFQEKSFVSITPNLFSHSLSFSRRVPILIRIPHRSSHFHARRKSICKKNLWGRSTSPTRAKCRYAARISFPGRGCLNSRNLRAQSTARPRYPFGILFNLSLSLYRICSATVDGETKSILYPAVHARARPTCIFLGYDCTDFSPKHIALPAKQNQQNFILFRCEKPFLRHFWKIT